MKARNMLTTMMVVGSIWALAGCSGSPLGPSGSDGADLRQTPPATEQIDASHPAGELPQLPKEEPSSPDRRKVE
jgi:hypothetical protein